MDWTDPSTLPLEEVKGLFVVLGKALRAQQLYDENNPVYKRFVSQLGESLKGLWDIMDRLPVSVEENRLTWMGECVYESETRSDSLAFLLYKDGIREITLHQGLEDHELVVFLEVLNQARDLRPQGDDLLTILWEKDLQYFTYSYIDMLAEGLDLELPAGGTDLVGNFQEILQDEVGEEEAGEEGEASRTQEQARDSSGVVRAEDFNPTLYSLDPKEMERLQSEVRMEMDRDLRGDVLAALFDRVEEPRFPERQQEILEIFETLLPNFLSRGAYRAVGDVLEELVRLLASKNALQPAQRETAEKILDEVSGAPALRELFQSLEDGSVSPDPQELAALFRHLRADALPALLRASEETEDPRIRETMQDAVGAIAKRYSDALLDCLRSDDSVIAAGAVRLAGKMRLPEAVSLLPELLERSEPEVRLAAIEGARHLKASPALGAVLSALYDKEEDVRVAAAKVLGETEYVSAAPELRKIIEGKEIRQADLSEQIAFFESYGMLRDPGGVKLLNRLLNGRGFLGRKESGEIRACAALALGKMGTEDARAALERAAQDQDPVVRSAVNRATRVER